MSDDEKCIINVYWSAHLDCPCGFEADDGAIPELLMEDECPSECPECGRETEWRA